jgi:hypothetical protein
MKVARLPSRRLSLRCLFAHRSSPDDRSSTAMPYDLPLTGQASPLAHQTPPKSVRRTISIRTRSSGFGF